MKEMVDSVSRGWRVVLPLAAALGAVCVLAPAALALRATTGPGARLEIYVIVTDQKLGFAVYALSDYAGPNELYLMPLQGIQRGDTALFTLVNKSTRPQAFAVLGMKTPLVKPGHRASFRLPLLYRGEFPYYASNGHTKEFRGSLRVY
jgi:hypothetical protein